MNNSKDDKNIVYKIANRVKEYKTIIGFIFFITLFTPIIINTFISICPYGIADNETWLQFWATWLGAIIGGCITIIGVYITLQENRKQFAETLKTDRDKYENDKRLSIMPHIKIDFKDSITPSNVFYFNYKKEKDDLYSRSTEVHGFFTLTNIGIGSALNIKFKIGGYIGKEPFILVDKIFDLGVKESIDIRVYLYDMNNESYDFEIEYEDLLNKCKYKQIGIILIDKLKIKTATILETTIYKNIDT